MDSKSFAKQFVSLLIAYDVAWGPYERVLDN